MANINDIFDTVEDVFHKVDGLPDSVQDAINKIIATIQKVDRIIAHEIPGVFRKVEHLPDEFARLFNVVLPEILARIRVAYDQILVLIRFLGADGGAATGFKNILQTFFENCGNILKTPIDELLGDTNFVRDAFKSFIGQLGNVAAELIEVLINTLATCGDEIAAVILPLAEKIGKLFQKIVTSLLEGFTRVIGSTSSFPVALSKGPLHSCKSMKELFEWHGRLGMSSDLTSRLDAVENSLVQLFSIIGTGNGLSLISDVIQGITRFIKRIIDPASDVLNIFDDFLTDVVFPKSVFSNLLLAASQGKVWNWAEFPAGLIAGNLGTWVNGNTYGGTAPLDLQREYRLRIVASADAYFREMQSTSSVSSGLTYSDRKLSPGLLSDGISAFIETTILFIFETATYVGSSLSNEAFDDLGASFAASISRQLRSTIRVTIGTLFRGVWVFSVQNEALIEMISSGIGSLFSSLVEGVVRNVTWVVELKSKYVSDSLGNIHADAPRIPSLDGYRADAIEYVAFLREAPSSPLPEIPPILLAFLNDYAAYVDMSYRQFATQNRLPSTRPSSGILNVTLDRQAKTLSVVLYGVNGPPVPVARIYILGKCYVMPYLGRGQYQRVVSLPYIPRIGRSFDVECLMSNGGYRKVTYY